MRTSRRLSSSPAGQARPAPARPPRLSRSPLRRTTRPVGSRRSLAGFGKAVLAAATVVTVAFGTSAGASAAAAPNPSGAAATGSVGIRLLDAPVAARGDPRARVYIVDHLAPGAVIHRRVEVSNTTADTAHVVLYAAAATITKGSFLGSAGHTRNDLSTWTSISPGSSDVPAGGRATSTVTISVPRDAAPGEQYGVVWAEVRSAPVAGAGVSQVSRVGIRLYVSVGPGGAPAAGFGIDSLTAERSPDGHPVVLAAVHNTGGRALDMNGTLRLSAGPGGLNAGPFNATLGTTLAIGDTEPVTISLDKQLPAGPWKASITLHSGLLERTATGTITFPAQGAAAAVATKTDNPVLLYAVIAGLAALLLIGVGVLIVVLRRRRRRPDHHRTPGEARKPVATR